jgi:hypothetical protein
LGINFENPHSIRIKKAVFINLDNEPADNTVQEVIVSGFKSKHSLSLTQIANISNSNYQFRKVISLILQMRRVIVIATPLHPLSEVKV